MSPETVTLMKSTATNARHILIRSIKDILRTALTAPTRLLVIVPAKLATKRMVIIVFPTTRTFAKSQSTQLVLVATTTMTACMMRAACRKLVTRARCAAHMA